MRRSFKHPLGPAVPLTFLLALVLVAPPAARAIAPAAAPGPTEAGEDGGGPPFRAAPAPSPLERARIARWHRAWREEAATLERSFDAVLRAVARGDDRALPPRCVALAGAVLDLDRPRVLPVPDRAADLHLRRALRHVARGALTCLTRRPYAARHAFEQAADAFAQARRVLDRYRRTTQRSRTGLAPP